MVVELTQSLCQWLFENHKEKLPLIMFGHTELFTPEMQEAYLKWCATEDGKKYLVGGSRYEGWDEPTDDELELSGI